MIIAYCIESFWNTGGMERVLAVKSNWLAENGHDITIIVANQQGKPYAFMLDERVRLIDLKCDVHDFENLYRKRLQEHIVQSNYDIVISMGGLEVRFLYSIMDGSEKIVELHFAWNRFIKSGNNFMNKVKGVIQTFRYLNTLRRYQHIVVLTKYDAKVYKRLGIKSSIIYDPCTIKSIGISKLQSHRVISVGRLDYLKGYDYLIKAWKSVEQMCPDWELHIFGEGPQRDKLRKLIRDLDVKHIFLRGASTTISDEYRSSSIYVMSSRCEGFALVLLEASVHGLPLIAYDCISGPKEIITNNENGLLIKPVGNIEKLATAINYLIENPDQRKAMGVKALAMSKKFSVDYIMGQWTQLFQDILA